MKKIFKDNYGVNKLFIKNLIIYFIIMIIVVVLPIILLYSNLNNKYYTQMKITNSGTLNRAIDTFDTMVSQVEMYAVDLYVKQEVKAFIAAENEHYFLEDVRDYLKFYKRKQYHIFHAFNDIMEVCGTVRVEGSRKTRWKPGIPTLGVPKSYRGRNVLSGCDLQTAFILGLILSVWSYLTKSGVGHRVAMF